MLHERSMNKMTTGTDISNSPAPIPSLSKFSDRVGASHMSDIHSIISSISPSSISRPHASLSTQSTSMLSSVPEPITVPHRSLKAVRNWKIPRSGEVFKARKPLLYTTAISNVKSSQPVATIASLSS